ncbi:unnamed protein product [Protopolystoma xenopodis]|uniref:Uncharacterized protein n=1 Tax=Protopolystoma xenopodis TaxID=117903 RepID=A0A448X9M2_9PLAT|nr:unnamed protein product [Protopolystoma xenopodis]
MSQRLSGPQEPRCQVEEGTMWVSPDYADRRSLPQQVLWRFQNEMAVLVHLGLSLRCVYAFVFMHVRLYEPLRRLSESLRPRSLYWP